MQNKKLIRFVESFILMPIMTMGLPIGGLPTAAIGVATNAPQAVLSQKLNIEAEDTDAGNHVLDIEALIIEEKARKIDAYFEAKKMPLAGHGKSMVLAAEKYDLDYRLLAAIAVQETTGGKNACTYTHKRTGDIGYKYNVFGWGSCRIKFESYEAGFEVLARNLSGNNPRTASFYANKTTEKILLAYNPAHIAPKYVPQVLHIMNTIGEKDLGLELALNN